MKKQTKNPNYYKYSCTSLLVNTLFSLSKYLGVELPDYRIDKHLTLLETGKHFSKMAVSLYIPIHHT